MEKEISIIIADDHPIFLLGLKEILESDAGLNLLGTAENGRLAIQLIEENKPDIAVLDFDMPDANAIDILEHLQKTNSKTKVLVLTMHKGEDLFNRVMDKGALGFILKENAVQDVIEGIRLASKGEPFISPTISSLLINRMRNHSKLEEDRQVLNQLTPSELKIIKLVAENLTSNEIAERLFVSYKTVENHRANICAKLGLKGSNSLLKFAIQNKNSIVTV